MIDPDRLAAGLLDPADAITLSASGKVDAAVLIPLTWTERGPVAVFTERHLDLRKHAGEISFPGGRRDPGEHLLDTALREAEEEIGLPREEVRILGALAPMGTFVSGYRIYPFVGLFRGPRTWQISEREVAQVLEFELADLAAAHRLERLWRKGVPVRTSTYPMDQHLIWGATARILHQLLTRIAV